MIYISVSHISFDSSQLSRLCLRGSSRQPATPSPCHHPPPGERLKSAGHLVDDIVGNSKNLLVTIEKTSFWRKPAQKTW